MNITRHNFEVLLPEIVESIESSAFVAVDGEYSGLEFLGSKYSFFDGGRERYEKARASLEQATIFQFGLATFRHNPPEPGSPANSNAWEVKVFNFALFPSSFEPLQLQFTSSASALQFLRTNHLDLNFVVDNGVSFLNDEQERRLKKMVLGSDWPCTDSLKMGEEVQMQKVCESVSDKLETVPFGTCWTIPIIGEVSSLSILVELQKRFHNIKVTIRSLGEHSEKDQVFLQDSVQKDGGVIWVEKVENNLAESDRNFKLQKETFVSRLLGFTKVFRTIANLHKPIVGHNVFMDLLMFYEKFYDRLPQDYEQWKFDFCKLCPNVYDTKFIIYQIRKSFENTDEAVYFEDTSLGGMYKAFETNSKSLPFCPNVKLAGAHSQLTLAAHEAGSDSFMAGVVLLKLAHLLFYKEFEVTRDSPTFYSYFSLLQPYKNCVNLIKAKNHSLCLHQRDPVSNRPPYLVMRKLTDGDTRISPSQAAEMLTSFGLADIKTDSSHKYLVIAFNSFGGMRAALREFRSSEEYTLHVFDKWKDKQSLRQKVWIATSISTALTFGSIFVLLHRS